MTINRSSVGGWNTAARVAAAILAVLLVLYMLMARHLLRTFYSGALDAAAFAFSLFVVGLAIRVFLTVRSPGASLLPELLMFPLAFFLDPIQLMYLVSVDAFCPRSMCDGADVGDIVNTFVNVFVLQKVWIVLWEVFAFALLFFLVRIAAGNMWPGRAGAPL